MTEYKFHFADRFDDDVGTIRRQPRQNSEARSAKPYKAIRKIARLATRLPCDRYSHSAFASAPSFSVVLLHQYLSRLRQAKESVWSSAASDDSARARETPCLMTKHKTSPHFRSHSAASSARTFLFALLYAALMLCKHPKWDEPISLNRRLKNIRSVKPEIIISGRAREEEAKKYFRECENVSVTEAGIFNRPVSKFLFGFSRGRN